MDVIALDQAGIGEAVAPLGTAMTETQLGLLWRLAPSPILCFDGDSAGRRRPSARRCGRCRMLAPADRSAFHPSPARTPTTCCATRAAPRSMRCWRAGIAGRAPVAARARGGAARHARAACRPQAPPARSRGRDRRSRRARPVSPRADWPFRRPHPPQTRALDTAAGMEKGAFRLAAAPHLRTGEGGGVWRARRAMGTRGAPRSASFSGRHRVPFGGRGVRYR